MYKRQHLNPKGAAAAHDVVATSLRCSHTDLLRVALGSIVAKEGRCIEPLCILDDAGCVVARLARERRSTVYDRRSTGDDLPEFSAALSVNLAERRDRIGIELLFAVATECCSADKESSASSIRTSQEESLSVEPSLWCWTQSNDASSSELVVVAVLGAAVGPFRVAFAASDRGEHS